MTASTPATPDPRVETIRQLLDSLSEPDLFPLADDAEAALASLAAELAAIKQAARIVVGVEDLYRDLPYPERRLALDAFEIRHREGMDALRSVLAGEDTT